MVNHGGWIDYSKQIEEAGADGLELNIYFLATDLDQKSEELEKKYVHIVKRVKSEIKIGRSSTGDAAKPRAMPGPMRNRAISAGTQYFPKAIGKLLALAADEYKLDRGQEAFKIDRFYKDLLRA